MKLIMENWRGFLIESPGSGTQLPDEKTDLLFDPEITAMLKKAGVLTEGERWDKAKAYAKKYSVPVATAIALLAAVPVGTMAGKGLADRSNASLAIQQADQAAAEDQAFIDRFGEDFGEMPTGFDVDQTNDQRRSFSDRAWVLYDGRTMVAAPVSGLVTMVVDGNIEGRPFVVYQNLSRDDVLPLLGMTAGDYRKKVQAQLEDDGERGIEYLRNQLFGDTGKWLSGSNNEMYKFVDGNPVLPPSWSVAYDVYAEAVVDRVDHIRGVAAISSAYAAAVSRAFNLDDADPQALEAFLQHELWKVGATTPADETE